MELLVLSEIELSNREALLSSIDLSYEVRLELILPLAWILVEVAILDILIGLGWECIDIVQVNAHE